MNFSIMSEYVKYVLYYGIADIKNRKDLNISIDAVYKKYLQNEKINIKDIRVTCKNALEKNLYELVCRLANEYVYNSKINEDIKTEILTIICDESNSLNKKNFLLAEHVLICSGLYELAYKFREAGNRELLERHTKRKYISSKYAIPLFWSYIQIDKKEEAYNVFERTSFIYKYFLKKEVDFLRGVLKKEVKKADICKRYKEDIEFEKLISGKKALIIGPAENGTDTEKYIDEHEIIVSMLYRDNLGVNIENKGHISYYSGLGCTKMQQNNDLHFFNKLDMAVFKGIELDFQKELLNKGKAREAYGKRTAYRNGIEGMNFSLLYPHITSGNLLQTILLDMLLFRPKCITVINVNLFLANKRYNSTYKVAGTEQNTKSFRRSFAVHNMINMYLLTKFLYDNKAISVDDTCKEVLELGIEEYMKRMQELEL